MTILRIEHAISNFDLWRRSFERGWTMCAARRRGLRGYRVFQPVDDPTCIKVDLEFDSPNEAESLRAALMDLRELGVPVQILAGTERALIVEPAESEGSALSTRWLDEVSSRRPSTPDRANPRRESP